MKAVAFERDTDEYEIQIGVIDATLSAGRDSAVLSSASANNRKLDLCSTRSVVWLKYKTDVRE